ncbi:RNA polymerase subunit sigma-24 [Bacillus sp. AFS001701]|uniref:RNA polymerase sigma factor n=1 Tax=Bacillaceae TaxID=186817 RepID=UPI000BF7F6AF|nr:RNA polymerase sigma factor [Bacillus sp. AFS001701]PET36196.1 RNA polymerase subunit sigma-24 [Bacillus sp. AFS001701]
MSSSKVMEEERGDAMESDEQLVRNIVKGNHQLFKELIVRYQSKVFAVALKVSNNQKDAEDISQEVFLQLYRSLENFNGESSLATWIYRITMNKAIDFKRKQVKQQENETSELLSTLQEENLLSPEEALIKTIDKELIHSYLIELPQAYSDVLKLYYFEELTYGEIALKLNVAVKTVESRLYRAKRLIKDKHKGGII